MPARTRAAVAKERVRALAERPEPMTAPKALVSSEVAHALTCQLLKVAIERGRARRLPDFLHHVR